MKARYWSASARIEILPRSTFCSRANESSKSIGPSYPSSSSTSCSEREGGTRGAGGCGWVRSFSLPGDRQYQADQRLRRHADQPSQNIEVMTRLLADIGNHEQEQQ